MNASSAGFTPVATTAAERRAGAAFGLWLRVALVGAMMVTAGVAILVERSASVGLGLFVIIVGSAVGYAGWHQGRAAFSRLDGEPIRPALAGREVGVPGTGITPILQ
ncbi:MAG: hypothetical protein ABI854_08850 [Betaproteobacteria bacterium]